MVDTTAHIAGVNRAMRTEQHDGYDVRVQTLAQTYPSPLGDVWDALTSPARIARWFSPVTVDAEVGGRYQVEGNAGGEILACVPPRDGAAGYRATWEFGGGVTWLAVDLAAVDDEHTLVTLTHTARIAEMPPGFWERYGPGATGVGWDLGLLGLALHLGDASSEIPPSEAEAWQVGPEGRSFSRAVADRWAEAQIADGGDPSAARRAADETYAFYVGEEVGSAD